MYYKIFNKKQWLGTGIGNENALIWSHPSKINLKLILPY